MYIRSILLVRISCGYWASYLTVEHQSGHCSVLCGIAKHQCDASRHL